MSVIPETSQDPIGPCGPLEQLVGDSCRHSKIAVVNCLLFIGAQSVISSKVIGLKSVMGCDSGHTLGVTLMISIMLKISDRARVINSSSEYNGDSGQVGYFSIRG